jgi:hypothetical protein
LLESYHLVEWSKRLGRERRTNPGFLSGNEAARESRRIQEMVRSLTASNKIVNQTSLNPKPQSISKTTPSPSREINKKRKQERFMNIGYDESFVVNFDKLDKITYIYGQEISWACPYKIIVSEQEIRSLTDLLENAKITLDNKLMGKLRETENFFVEVMRNDSKVALYKKWFTEGRFKLMFNQKELELIIKLLKKTITFIEDFQAAT